MEENNFTMVPKFETIGIQDHGTSHRSSASKRDKDKSEEHAELMMLPNSSGSKKALVSMHREDTATFPSIDTDMRHSSMNTAMLQNDVSKAQPQAQTSRVNNKESVADDKILLEADTSAPKFDALSAVRASAAALLMPPANPKRQKKQTHKNQGEVEESPLRPSRKLPDSQKPIRLGESQPAQVDRPAMKSIDPDDIQIIVTATNSDGTDGLGGTLRAEASDNWVVADEVCSLQVAGGMMKIPKSLYIRLYDYQRSALAWMWNLYHKRSGGILADEIGLGKIVQIAAFLACLKFTDLGSHFLVVAPSTFLEHWRIELKSWTNETKLAVHLFHGTKQQRKAALHGMGTLGGVMLIPYDLVPSSIHFLRTSRNSHWDVLVVDEGHALKNCSCVTGKALRHVQAHSRFLLTSIPFQNKLSDLWAFMDFIQPGLLGNHMTFARNFSEQIAKGSKLNASSFDMELKNQLTRELKRLTAPHFLRRLKSEVTMASVDGQALQPASLGALQELPLRTDVVLWLNLTPAQEELYNMYLGSDIVQRARGGTECGIEVLPAINVLKKLCNHPMLCLPQHEYDHWKCKFMQSGRTAASGSHSSQSGKDAYDTGKLTRHKDSGLLDVESEVEDDGHGFLARLRSIVSSSVQGAALLSCKLRVLSVLLPQLQKHGHRCLIFSQNMRMLDLIQTCVLRSLGLKFLRIDGTIDATDRDLKLNKFHAADSRYFAICLSIEVGDIELMITGADRVILVDPAWNPSQDAQAIDHVHRLGQQHDVVIYWLIGCGSIEDTMFRLQLFKYGTPNGYLEQDQILKFCMNKDLKQLLESPTRASSTLSLMGEQIRCDASENVDLRQVLANDIGSSNDVDALPFWQSYDVVGFSDYQLLFKCDKLA